MKYMIVTQTFPPRTGGMQNVMDSICKRLSINNEIHIFPDHFLSKKYRDSNFNINIHNNFSPKILRPYVKRQLKFYKASMACSWTRIFSKRKKV